MTLADVPRIRSNQLWRAREAKCLAIIARALILLRQRDLFPEPEVELNREFYFCLITASRDLYPDDEVGPHIRTGLPNFADQNSSFLD